MAESISPDIISSKIDDKRSRRNLRRRERYQERKSEDPEYLSKESQRRKEQKLKNPESHAKFLFSEKQKRSNQNREILEKIMDKLYHENKSTFPFPVSQSKWEKLKKEELDWMFVFNPLKLTSADLTIRSLMDHRKVELSYIKENPNHPCASSIIFYVKTMVHNPKDQRRLTDEEKTWIKNFHLDAPNIEEQKYIYDQTEYKKEKRKEYYAKEKLSQKTVNLNLRFIKADPNKVLSIDEITNNPFVSNFCAREEYKIQLWKNDKNPEFLEKWRRQRQDYEESVKELSIEYKENFLKNKDGWCNSCRNV